MKSTLPIRWFLVNLLRKCSQYSLWKVKTIKIYKLYSLSLDPSIYRHEEIEIVSSIHILIWNTCIYLTFWSIPSRAASSWRYLTDGYGFWENALFSSIVWTGLKWYLLWGVRPFSLSLILKNAFIKEFDLDIGFKLSPMTSNILKLF